MLIIPVREIRNERRATRLASFILNPSHESVGICSRRDVGTRCSCIPVCTRERSLLDLSHKQTMYPQAWQTITGPFHRLTSWNVVLIATVSQRCPIKGHSLTAHLRGFSWRRGRIQRELPVRRKSLRQGKSNSLARRLLIWWIRNLKNKSWLVPVEHSCLNGSRRENFLVNENWFVADNPFPELSYIFRRHFRSPLKSKRLGNKTRGENDFWDFFG